MTENASRPADGRPGGIEDCPQHITVSGHEGAASRVAAVEARLAANPHILAELDRFVLRHIESGARFGVQEFAEFVRWHVLTDNRGDDFRVDNSDLPIIARLAVERHPDARPLIELRRSRFDAVFGERDGLHGGCGSDG